MDALQYITISNVAGFLLGCFLTGVWKSIRWRMEKGRILGDHKAKEESRIRREQLEEEKRIRDAKQNDIFNPTNQLRFIDDAEYKARKRIISEESIDFVLDPVQNHLNEQRQGYRILAEISLGSFIETRRSVGTKEKRDRAFASYRAKRADFVIVNRHGEPLLVIEYDGTGHDKNIETEEQRERQKQQREIKKEVVKRAGIGFLVVPAEAPVTETLQNIGPYIAKH